MSQPSRSILKMIFTNFVNSLKPRSLKGEQVGKDHLGNKYFQIVGSANQKTQRWFDPNEKDNFQQEIPAEWESWLRYRRKVPPTETEVLANAALAKQKKINAVQLEVNKPIEIKQVTGSNFPSYDEYEQVPGVNHKTKENL